MTISRAPRAISIPIYCASATSVTNMPAANQELFSGVNRRRSLDASGYREIACWVGGGVVGAAGSTFEIQYTINGTDWIDTGATVSMEGLTTTTIGVWATLPVAARVPGVIFRGITANGNGVADPTIGDCGLMLR